MDDNKLARIGNARNARVVTRAAADDKPVIDNTCGVFGKDPLPRCVNATPKEAPLPTVCVTANGQFNACFTDVRFVVFGMMTKQNAELLGSSKFT